MTPSDSSRWMRFQHGVEDRPTREPISATESAASSCRTARIFRSMASIWRIFFQNSGASRLYREDYSKSSADQGSARRQECLDFRPGRRPGRAAYPAAFDAGNRGAEAHRLDLAATFGQGQREAAVERVPGAERIDRVDGEYRQLAKLEAFAKQNVVRPIAHRDEGAGLARDALEPGGKIGNAGGGAQAFRGKDHVGCEAKQRIVFAGRPVA